MSICHKNYLQYSVHLVCFEINLISYIRQVHAKKQLPFKVSQWIQLSENILFEINLTLLRTAIQGFSVDLTV